MIKNKEQVLTFLENNKDKQLSVNLKLKYSGTANIIVTVSENNLKKQVLLILKEKDKEYSNVLTLVELAELSKKAVMKATRRKIVMTTPELLPLVVKLFAKIGKSKKVKTIKMLKIDPTSTLSKSIISSLAQKKIVVKNKNFSTSLGSNLTVDQLDKLLSEVYDSISENIRKRFTFTSLVYSTFSKPVLVEYVK
jgi:hypothetical protein